MPSNLTIAEMRLELMNNALKKQTEASNEAIEDFVLKILNLSTIGDATSMTRNAYAEVNAAENDALRELDRIKSLSDEEIERLYLEKFVG